METHIQNLNFLLADIKQDRDPRFWSEFFEWEKTARTYEEIRKHIQIWEVEPMRNGEPFFTVYYITWPLETSVPQALPNVMVTDQNTDPTRRFITTRVFAYNDATVRERNKLDPLSDRKNRGKVEYSKSKWQPGTMESVGSALFHEGIEFAAAC